MPGMAVLGRCNRLRCWHGCRPAVHRALAGADSRPWGWREYIRVRPNAALSFVDPKSTVLSAGHTARIIAPCPPSIVSRAARMRSGARGFVDPVDFDLCSLFGGFALLDSGEDTSEVTALQTPASACQSFCTPGRNKPADCFSCAPPVVTNLRLFPCFGVHGRSDPRIFGSHCPSLSEWLSGDTSALVARRSLPQCSDPSVRNAGALSRPLPRHLSDSHGHFHPGCSADLETDSADSSVAIDARTKPGKHRFGKARKP